jgi:DNA-3-methyladenine glycosylase II
MNRVANPETLKKAAVYLTSQDPHLASVITVAGLSDIAPHTNYYQALVDSIIGQQLSVKAARSIRGRFYGLFDSDTLPAPEQILSKSVEELRTAGLSGAKARYIQDLALHVLEGKPNFATLDTLSNQEIIAELTAVKGVGEWTAHMFMMFCMGRLDVLPTGDLGIRNGIMKLYGLEQLPSPEKTREIAVKYNWHPYESVASWYIWHSLDNAPKD